MKEGRVLPDDQGFWERLPESEEAWASVSEWVRGWWGGVQTNLARLPEGSIVYDIWRGLEADEIPDIVQELGGPEELDEIYAFNSAVFWDRVSDLHDCTLRAFRRTTSADEWLYAASEEGNCYRFWPHRAPEDARWYVSPVPDGDDQFFASQDFQWGIVSLFALPRWLMCVFGQPLLDAFAAGQPRAFSHPIPAGSG